MKSSATDARDIGWMRVALALGRRGLGSAAPNPAVGCVIVKDGFALGRGATAAGGRPHAEQIALQRAGAAARGATAYVSLEPCAVPGRGPACADELIGAGIARVVYAVGDPHEAVDGEGAAKLRSAGIEVMAGLLAAEAERDHAGFFRYVRTGRPLVTLKIASSLDGRIATATGASRWITGPEARQAGHALRLAHDAVLIGAGTLRADDPRLNARLPGLPDPARTRIVLAGRAPVPAARRLFAEPLPGAVWLVLPEAASAPAGLSAAVETLRVAADGDGRPLPAAVLDEIGRRGITRLLIEGGGRTGAAFLAAGLVDRLAWFRAPTAIGGDGVPALAALGIAEPDAASRWRLVDRRPAGADTAEFYEREAGAL
jgi:diaminohydroxyphosphoribosylaminopyrimidine deaminase / 5-amino-6-(5-phosphoribosylamino)uracil reductase